MATYPPAQLFEDFSLEMTGKDVPGFLEAAPLIPQGTRVNVTFLGDEDLQMRLVASKAVLDGGVRPEGHPDISDDKLCTAITGKHATLTEQGTTGTILTPFGFDEDPVVAWIEKVRGAGIDDEIRVGVPGPAGIKRLLSFAARFGVASSAGTAGPDKFIRRLAKKFDPAKHGVVKLHFYTFGGLTETSEWIREFKEKLWR